MPETLKYIVDESGQRTSVLVPVKVWDDLNASYKKLQNKLDVLTGIQKGLQEIRQSGKSGHELQTLKDFLK